MKIILASLGTVALLSGAAQGLALGGAPGFGEPVIEGYIGGLAPVVFGAIGAFILCVAKLSD
jgi:hypothetical protein